MTTVQVLFKNPIMAEPHSKAREKLLDQFPDLKRCNHEQFLSLSSYLDDTPERFYSKSDFLLMLSFLKSELSNNPKKIEENLNQKIELIDKSFSFLASINKEKWHDSYEDYSDYDFIRFCDLTLHPTYLKLIEGVLFPFILIIAEHSRLNRGKSIERLDVYNCVEELKNSKYNDLCTSYNNTIRNGIAHGGIIYKHKENKYSDKRNNDVLMPHRELLRIVDNLIDTCNGIALALKLFLIIDLNSNQQIPHQLMIEELQYATKSPWWEIEGCLPSEAMGQSQLIVYARPKSRDYNKIQYLAMLSGVLTEMLQPGFGRYFLSIKSSFAPAGWAAFDGKKLRKAREQINPKLEDYEDVLENGLVYFVPDFKLPRFLGILDSFWQSLRIHIPLVLEEMSNQLNKIRIVNRVSKIHRNGWRVVLNGSVVLSFPSNENANDLVKQSCKRIIHKALKDARRQVKKRSLERYLPLGYARIVIFNEDFRTRKLLNYGLGSCLVGTIQLKRIKRINIPDIAGSEVEIYKNIQIAWNKSWLNSTTGE